MFSSTSVISAALLACVYLLFFCWAESSPWKTATKTASMAFLAIAGWLSGAPWLIVAALGLSALGDFALSLRGDKGLLPGMGAFALAHLAYVIHFMGVSTVPLAGLPLDPLAWIYLGLGLSVPFWLLRHTGDLRIPVIIYVGVIVVMGLSSRLAPAFGVGAALFILSDLVLSLELFVLTHLRGALRAVPFIVWGAYWSGQALILLAALPTV